MSHQHHFLTRLDRLSIPHVELALSLYRAPEIVRYVLHAVRLPDQAPRVALSLDDPALGPFLVVTRDGVFVTCLGAGMSPGELPVVPRGQLDALLAKVSDLRARADVLLGMSDQIGGIAGVFRRLYEAADNLSREEMIAASALQPLYAFELFRLLVSATTDLEPIRERIMPILRRARKLTGDTTGLLRTYYKTVWMVGHLSVLTGMSGPKLLDTLGDELSEEMLKIPISWPAVRQGVVGLALRGAWTAARIGKPYLALYKRRLPAASSPLTCLDSTLSLGAMAFRHSRLRAEIEKALASAAAVLEAAGSGTDFPAAATRLAANVFELAGKHPEALENRHYTLGCQMAFAMTRSLPKDSPFAFERPEDVPRDLALTLMANSNNSLIANAEAVAPTYFMLPWVARASAEELYLPRDFIRATRVPWVPEHTYDLLRPMAEMYRESAARPAGPARKGPCPCGSGKKYKRCCGAEGGAEGGEDGSSAG